MDIFLKSSLEKKIIILEFAKCISPCGGKLNVLYIKDYTAPKTKGHKYITTMQIYIEHFSTVQQTQCTLKIFLDTVF